MLQNVEGSGMTERHYVMFFRKKGVLYFYEHNSSKIVHVSIPSLNEWDAQAPLYSHQAAEPVKHFLLNPKEFPVLEVLGCSDT
jgi:hypothetical protein